MNRNIKKKPINFRPQLGNIEKITYNCVRCGKLLPKNNIAGIKNGILKFKHLGDVKTHLNITGKIHRICKTLIFQEFQIQNRAKKDEKQLKQIDEKKKEIAQKEEMNAQRNLKEIQEIKRKNMILFNKNRILEDKIKELKKQSVVKMNHNVEKLEKKYQIFKLKSNRDYDILKEKKELLEKKYDNLEEVEKQNQIRKLKIKKDYDILKEKNQVLEKKNDDLQKEKKKYLSWKLEKMKRDYDNLKKKKEDVEKNYNVLYKDLEKEKKKNLALKKKNRDKVCGKPYKDLLKTLSGKNREIENMKQLVSHWKETEDTFYRDYTAMKKMKESENLMNLQKINDLKKEINDLKMSNLEMKRELKVTETPIPRKRN